MRTLRERLLAPSRPLAGSFSWVNQGASATLNTVTDGSLLLNAPATAGPNIRALVKAAPPPPYSLTAELDFGFMDVDQVGAGICFREDSTGELSLFGVICASGHRMRAESWTSATVFSGVVRDAPIHNIPRWLRISDDGTTNRTYEWSLDGEHFMSFTSQARTTFLTADQIGFWGFNNNTADGVQLRVFSWVEA